MIPTSFQLAPNQGNEELQEDLQETTGSLHNQEVAKTFPEWRNWQTQQTQNLPGITPRVGSTPSSGTYIFRSFEDNAETAIYKGF